VVQSARKRRCCHRRTVSGVTITRDRRHPAQTRASQTHQKSRSVGCSLGRVTVRLYTASWWRRARFSRASWAVAAGEEREETKQVEQCGDHETRLSPDPSR
jgi:hypothetical protein